MARVVWLAAQTLKAVCRNRDLVRSARSIISSYTAKQESLWQQVFMLQPGDGVWNASGSRIKAERSIPERCGPIMFGRKGLHKLGRPRIVEAQCGIDAADQAEQAVLQDVKSPFRNRPFDRGNEFGNLRIVHI